MNKTDHWQELKTIAEAMGIAVDGRWSEATLQERIDASVSAGPEALQSEDEFRMSDENTVVEGEDLEQERQALVSKLQAMGEHVHPEWDVETLQAKITKKQQEQLMREAQSIGISCDPSWSVEQLQAAIEEARTPGETPEGIAVVHLLVEEGEGQEVTCIAPRGVHLGDGQKLKFKERALVPPDVAEALKGKDLCL